MFLRKRKACTDRKQEGAQYCGSGRQPAQIGIQILVEPAEIIQIEAKMIEDHRQYCATANEVNQYNAVRSLYCRATRRNAPANLMSQFGLCFIKCGETGR